MGLTPRTSYGFSSLLVDELPAVDEELQTTRKFLGSSLANLLNSTLLAEKKKRGTFDLEALRKRFREEMGDLGQCKAFGIAIAISSSARVLGCMSLLLGFSTVEMG